MEIQSPQFFSPHNPGHTNPHSQIQGAPRLLVLETWEAKNLIGQGGTHWSAQSHRCPIHRAPFARWVGI